MDSNIVEAQEELAYDPIDPKDRQDNDFIKELELKGIAWKWRLSSGSISLTIKLPDGSHIKRYRKIEPDEEFDPITMLMTTYYSFPN